jgi:hypothetical protein
MDGDDFSRAHRLGRMAAEVMWETVTNDAKEVDLDLFAATR